VCVCVQVQEEMKRKEMGRRPREERDIVKERLFGAFEKHQYYNVKDLVTLTNQPVVSTPAYFRSYYLVKTANITKLIQFLFC
jgi:ribose 1,5-bisphosphokinase PhnN